MLVFSIHESSFCISSLTRPFLFHFSVCIVCIVFFSATLFCFVFLYRRCSLTHTYPRPLQHSTLSVSLIFSGTTHYMQMHTTFCVRLYVRVVQRRVWEATFFECVVSGGDYSSIHCCLFSFFLCSHPGFINFINSLPAPSISVIRLFYFLLSRSFSPFLCHGVFFPFFVFRLPHQ